MLSQEFVCPVLITVIHACPRQNVSRAPLNFIYKKIYVANCVQMDSILNKLVGLAIIVLHLVRLVMDRLQWSVMGASLDTFYMEQYVRGIAHRVLFRITILICVWNV